MLGCEFVNTDANSRLNIVGCLKFLGVEGMGLRVQGLGAKWESVFGNKVSRDLIGLHGRCSRLTCSKDCKEWKKHPCISSERQRSRVLFGLQRMRAATTNKVQNCGETLENVQANICLTSTEWAKAHSPPKHTSTQNTSLKTVYCNCFPEGVPADRTSELGTGSAVKAK